MKMPSRNDRSGVVLFLLALITLAFQSSSAAPPDASGKPVSTETIGPPAVLSAAQRAALDAKRAATLTSPRAPEVAPRKAAAVSTIPSGAPATGLEHQASGAKLQASPIAGRRAASPTLARRTQDEAGLAALIAALGPERAWRAGLTKRPPAAHEASR